MLENMIATSEHATHGVTGTPANSTTQRDTMKVKFAFCMYKRTKSLHATSFCQSFLAMLACEHASSIIQLSRAAYRSASCIAVDAPCMPL